MNSTKIGSFLLVGTLALFTANCGSAEDVGETELPNPEEVAEPNSPDPQAAATSSAALANEIFTLVNNARKTARSCGGVSYKAAPALTRNAALDTAARNHSVDMAAKNYFDHYSKPSGKSPFQRMKDAGYNYRTAGENIAAGNSVASKTLDQWLKSAGHCKNIMNPAFKETGLGVGLDPSSTYKTYWTQTFGAR